ncbi:MAG: STAS domain-containing protein [Solirubrobacterales bacterium]
MKKRSQAWAVAQGFGRESENNGREMEIEVKRLGGRGIEIVPIGRLDAGTVGELRRALLDRVRPEPRVLLNVSALDAIDPAGMALLMMARVELEATGSRFVVECTDAGLMRRLLGAGMSRFVTIAQRRLDSMRALGEDAQPETLRRTFSPARVPRSITPRRSRPWSEAWS